MKKYYTVTIPKIGTHIDDNAFGGHYVDKWHQEKMIEMAKQRWKNTITCPLSLYSKMHANDKNHVPSSWIEYYTASNPYYGWKENQLKIVIEK